MGLLLVPALVFAAGETVEKWTVRDYWGKLEVKTTAAVVLDLLGQPLEKEHRKGTEIWYYQQTLKYATDNVIERPRHGFLMFKTTGDNFLLYKWTEPDWTTITPHTEAQYLKELTRLEAERKRQLSQLQRQRRSTERKVQQEQQQAKTEPVLTEEEKEQQEEVRERNRQMKAEYKAKQGKSYKAMNYKLWFMIGGLMLAAAVLLSFVGGFRRR